ncbi:MAG: T9SS type A sorting domain-containing protein [Bacteroidetes bacterium]|nr:T9SS type A sorting domain-containing protein [Bacteroidota bacterium]
MKKLSIVSILLLSVSFLSAQEKRTSLPPYKQNSNFYRGREEAQKFFEKEQAEKAQSINKKDKDEAFEEQEEYSEFKRWENFWKDRVLPDGSYPSSSFLQEEFEKRNLNANRSSASSFSGNWTCISQTNCIGGYDGMGRTTCTAFDPFDPNVFYVGAPNGGIWKTTDGGLTYAALGDQLPFVSAGSIVVDFNDPNILYVSTGDAVGWWNYSMGVYKSTDGGATWNPTPLSWQLSGQIAVYKLLMNPANSSMVYAATTNGLYRTINGGSNWTKVINAAVNDIEIKPGDPSVIFASTDDYWGSSEVFESPDSGATWNQVSSFSLAQNSIKIAITPADPNFLAAFTSQGMSLYVSTSSVVSFSLRQTNLPGMASFFVSSLNQNIMYCGGVVVQQSTDGGMTWNQITDWWNSGAYPEIHADLHNICWNPLRPNDLYFSNDGGIYRYHENNQVWTELSDNLVITQFYSLATSQTDPYFLIGGTQDNGGRKRVAQNSWASTNGGDAMVTAIDENNDQVIYTTYVNGQLYRSRDRWSNDQYHEITPTDSTGNHVSGNWVTPYLLNPQNNNSIYAGYHDVYKSTNQGDSWIPLNLTLQNSSGINTLEVAPSDTNVIYASQANYFYYSYDHGQNWNNTALGGTETISSIAIDPTNPMHVWITRQGFSNHVYKSVNGGQSFQNITGGLPNVPANASFYEPNSANGIYVGTDIGVFYLNDSLPDWISFSQDLPAVQVTDFALYRATNKLRISTYGRGIWESDMYSILNGITVPAKTTGFSIYPNPNEGVFTIDYPSNGNVDGTFEILDVMGHLVGSFTLPAAENKLTITTGKISTGVYLYRGRIDATIQFWGKIVIQ